MLEISDDQIIAEACSWFRSSFYTGSSPPITNNYRQIFLITALLGAVVAFFPFVSYMRPIVHRHHDYNPRKIEDPNQKKKVLLYMGGYILATAIAFLLLLPLSSIFTQNLNFIMANYFVGLFIGYAIGLLVVFYLVHRYVDKDPRPLLRRIKEQISNNFNGAFAFGLITFLFSFGTLAGIMQWSMFDLIPTTREIGATILVAIVLFPYTFLDQLYTRNLQDHMQQGRLKEWFKVVFISSLMKTVLFIPLLFVNLGLTSLVIIILLVGLPVIELLATWIYMRSGRNFLSPAIYISLFLAWILVAVMPFGNYSAVFL